MVAERQRLEGAAEAEGILVGVANAERRAPRGWVVVVDVLHEVIVVAAEASAVSDYGMRSMVWPKA